MPLLRQRRIIILMPHLVTVHVRPRRNRKYATPTSYLAFCCSRCRDTAAETGVVETPAAFLHHVFYAQQGCYNAKVTRRDHVCLYPLTRRPETTMFIFDRSERGVLYHPLSLATHLLFGLSCLPSIEV